MFSILKISGHLEIEGKRYHAEDVLIALMKQGISVDIMENQNHSLKIDNKLIEPDNSLFSQEKGNSCPYINDMNEIKNSLQILKEQMLNMNPSRNNDMKSSYYSDTKNQKSDSGYISKSKNMNSYLNQQKPNQRENKFTYLKDLHAQNSKNASDFIKSNSLFPNNNKISLDYLSNSSTCINCNAKVSVNTKYCHSCGSEMTRPSKLSNL